jgi:excinuclease ABC subunit C
MARAPTPTGEPLLTDDGNLSDTLRETLERLPREPGVYLMKDKKGRVVYVGKAANLRSRVRSYFSESTSDYRAFVGLLSRILGDIETVVTNNEKEALLLENNLIKQHQPRFNVKLVDDKNFLVLRLDPKARYPRLEVVRRIGHDGARYFGPYHSASSCRAALTVVNRHFKLRTCTDHVLNSRKRPCLQYQIKRCDAPCVFDIGADEYGKQVQDVALFLDGKDDELLERLKGRMKAAAVNMEYEAAASLRDQITALDKTLEAQRVVSQERRDQDVMGLYREGDAVELVVMTIRHGKLLGRRDFALRGQEFPTDEVLTSFVSLYYELGNQIPDDIVLPHNILDADVKAEWLSDKRGRRVEIIIPQRGPKRRLVELADKNAASAFVTRRDKTDDIEAALGKLRDRLSLKRVPKRIECFDISHIQGTSTVASMVVFIDGQPSKADYRTFKVQSAGNDDFASMYEVISRRFRRANAGEAGWTAPDLLVIDGGKGQLSSVMAALKDARVDIGMNGIDVVALAKERVDGADEKQPDRVFTQKTKDPIKLRPNSTELYLLSRIRDEAHRFAVTFHGKVRRNKSLRSSLQDVDGVGPKRAKTLLNHFGSLSAVREASVEALAAAPGMSRAVAEAVHLALAGPTHEPTPPAEPILDESTAPVEEVAEDAASAEIEALTGDP